MTKSKTTHQLLPTHLAEAAPPAVTEAITRVVDALAAVNDAAASEREAAVALEAAPQEYDAALRSVIEAKKPTPAPTEPQRKAELEAARQRSDKATALAREAAAHYRRTLDQEGEGLVRVQTPRVDDAAAEFAPIFDALADQIDRFALEVGVLQGLHHPRRDRSQAAERRRGLRDLSVDVPTFDPDPATVIRQKLVELGGAVEDMRRDATPMWKRILGAIGDQTLSWDDVAATLAIPPLDAEACIMRDFLLGEGTLEWCDSDGAPLVPASVMARARTVVVQQRCLRRNDNPPLSPTQQARLESAGRAA